MTDKKYYTPTIEEFHVGFEFETKYILFSRNGEWMKCIFSVNELWFWDEYEHDAYKTEFRVKYLDREDIESLGWFYKQTTDSGLDYFWDDKTQKHSIIHSYITGWTVITVRDDARKEDYTSFAGYVKNKSELKRLMKQLGI